MRYIYPILFFLPFLTYAQSGPSESASGTIEIPILLNMDISQLANQNLEFVKWSDFANGKTINAAYGVTVQSNTPWVVTVMAGNQYFSPVSSNASNDMPVSLLSVKKTSSLNFIPLSMSPQTLMQSDNDNIENVYTLDMKMEPPFNYKGGQYNLNLIFSVTPQ